MFRKPGAEAWESLGKFSASESAIAALGELLKDREPYEALEQIRAIDQMLFDTLDILQADGFEARLRAED
jgi:uncharacterized protein (DUF934 family)